MYALVNHWENEGVMVVMHAANQTMWRNTYAFNSTMSTMQYHAIVHRPRGSRKNMHRASYPRYPVSMTLISWQALIDALASKAGVTHTP